MTESEVRKEKITLLKAMEDCCQRMLSNPEDSNYVKMQSDKLDEYFNKFKSL